MTKYFIEPFATAGDKVEIPTPLQSSGSVSYNQGFGYDYQRNLASDPLAKSFPRQGFNGLMNDVTSAIKQYQENGFFEFITPEMNGGKTFAYALAACVRFDMSEAKDGSDIRIFCSRLADNKTSPKQQPDNWIEIGKVASGSGISYGFTTVSQDTTLTIEQSGVVLIDASAGNIVVTLPNTELNIGYKLQRIDSSENTVTIVSQGLDKIKHNLHLSNNGYELFYLFGAGDYLEVACDGNHSWWPISRKDESAIGRVFFDTSIITPIGGYMLADGRELDRRKFPFLWDFAQKSGMLVDDDSREGFEGCWGKGDGVETFSIPDLRGEFLRALDNERGVDVTKETIGEGDEAEEVIIHRTAGSWQEDELISHTHESAISGPTGNGLYWPSNAGIEIGATSAQGGKETRPRNTAYPIYMKIL